MLEMFDEERWRDSLMSSLNRGQETPRVGESKALACCSASHSAAVRVANSDGWRCAGRGVGRMAADSPRLAVFSLRQSKRKRVAAETEGR